VNQPDAELSARITRLAIENIGREYPNAPGHLLRSAADLRPPRELHPAFFGSYDWHSSVHQHWLLARLLRLDLAGVETDAARRALAATLRPEAIEIEAAYLRERPSFERTYGWAWLLKLADELASWQHADADTWSRALAPAVHAVATNWTGFLRRVTYPIRAGTHANSAFGLALALDHARATGDSAFASALADQALRWFEHDRDYPAHLEPGGDDFLSGALMEVAAMTRLLDRAAFAEWFATFLPSPPSVLLEPATVADRSDAKTVHLDGLNLSRAWCWRTIFAVTGDRLAERAAERHLDASLPHVFSGEYVGEHWLSSFALLALTE
jgi:hypothetical protein